MTLSILMEDGGKLCLKGYPLVHVPFVRFEIKEKAANPVSIRVCG